MLLRARAIECQCYVIAAAQAGQHNAKRESYGHALIIDPWGGRAARCQRGPPPPAPPPPAQLHPAGPAAPRPAARPSPAPA